MGSSRGKVELLTGSWSVQRPGPWGEWGQTQGCEGILHDQRGLKSLRTLPEGLVC